MIKLTGFNNKEIYLNEDHIEKLESVPESVITLTNGNKYIVEDSIEDIIRKIIEYKKSIYVFKG